MLLDTIAAKMAGAAIVTGPVDFGYVEPAALDAIEKPNIKSSVKGTKNTK